MNISVSARILLPLCEQVETWASQHGLASDELAGDLIAVGYAALVSLNVDAIGPNVRRERLSNGWSLRDLEARSGVTFSYIHAIEHGTQRNPSIRHLISLASALGVTIVALLTPQLVQP